MATVTSTPGSLNIVLRKSDEFETLLDFSISAVGCTVSSEIVSTVTGGVVGEFATSVYDAGAGQVNIALSETQTGQLAVGTYLWRNVWNKPGDVRKTMLTGYLEVVK